MLDPFAVKFLKTPLEKMAAFFVKKGVKPDQITLAGFVFAVFSFFSVCAGWYGTGLFFIAVNRIMDGLDGAVARLTQRTDAGGFLDICLDFIFYSGVVTGFALSDPPANAVPAVLLIFSFIGTGTSFLAFAVMAQKHKLKNLIYPHKSMFYIGGLTEGTETILFFVLFCIFPDKFPILAIVFAFLCFFTTITRVVAGYSTLRQAEEKNREK